MLTSLKSQDKWELQKSEDGIDVYTSVVKGSTYKKFKATTILNCKPMELVEILRRVEKYPEWIANCEKVELLKQDNTVQYHYIETELPWPFENRDMIYQLKYDIFDENNIQVSINGVPNYIDEKKGVVRMSEVSGKWLFKSISTNQTELVYVLHSEPGGAIPAWLANASVVDMPYNTISALNKKISLEY